MREPVSPQLLYQYLGLLQIGRDEKIRRIVGIIRPENDAMKGICEKLGFRLTYRIDEPVIQAEIEL